MNDRAHPGGALWANELRALLRVRSVHQNRVVGRLNHTQRRKIFRCLREKGQRADGNGPRMDMSNMCVLASLDPEDAGADHGGETDSQRAETPLAAMSVDDFSMFHVLQSLDKKKPSSPNEPFET